MKFFFRRMKSRPYRNVARLERRTAKTHSKYMFRKLLEERPELRKQPVSRLWQKRRIKRQYQKARRAELGARALLGRAVKLAAQLLSAHKAAAAVIVIALFLIFAVTSCTASCGAMLTGAFTGAMIPSYMADDPENTAASLRWTEMEMKLKQEIEDAEEEHPGFDAYVYWRNGVKSSMETLVAAVKHDPFEIISFLNAMYEDFRYREITGVLDELFSKVYNLEFEEKTEIRTYTDDDGEEVEYEWRILNIRLDVEEFYVVAAPILQGKEDAPEKNDIYIETGGGHQRYQNPLDFDWTNSITSPFGYRKNPTGAGYELHTGVDISAPFGTSVRAAQDGTVTGAGWHRMYGYNVTIADEEKRQSRYAHCSSLLVAAGQKVKMGDVIALVGSTGNATGNHLHVEIKESGEFLNPIFLLEFTLPKETEETK